MNKKRIVIVVAVLFLLAFACNVIGGVISARQMAQNKADKEAASVLSTAVAGGSDEHLAVEAITAVKEVSIQAQNDIKQVSIASIIAVTTTAVSGDITQSCIAIGFFAVIIGGLLMLFRGASNAKKE